MNHNRLRHSKSPTEHEINRGEKPLITAKEKKNKSTHPADRRNQFQVETKAYPIQKPVA